MSYVVIILFIFFAFLSAVYFHGSKKCLDTTRHVFDNESYKCVMISVLLAYLAIASLLAFMFLNKIHFPFLGHLF